MPEGAQVLCHGVSWPDSEGIPRLALRTPDGTPADVPLAPGTRLGFAVLPGNWCLGHTTVASRTERASMPCPDRAPAARGHQCGPCFARDDTRHMHDFHRSGIAPPGLRDYLAQEHWLYVATFAHGASKVGTAAAPGKWRRLAEQGAVAARYVALAADGRTVRLLEDAVTARLGIGQAVRSAAKAAGLAAPVGNGEGDGGPAALNARLAHRVRGFLRGTAGEGPFAVVEEEWAPPAVSAPLLRAWRERRTQPYPGHPQAGRLGEGGHGFTVEAVLGQVLLVRLADSPVRFVADAAPLKGKLLRPGHQATAAPAVQELLF
ncbi:DUF2797 domain-containing protein [Zafaria cholistanensis]|uniref:DUF2797 domain-containing protein n=1 Tax=Zafaria cholistanensis TaxID=1682741 RepID=UPI001CED1783|nr:DUF2797 domain-containing protein [Zafaria cholistanensis]